MKEMAELLRNGSLVFAMGIAPPFLLYTLWNRLKIRGVQLQWKQPALAGVTIFTFMSNLFFFIFSAVLVSCLLGRKAYPVLNFFPGHSLQPLLISSFAMMAGITLIFLGLQIHLSNFITAKGIYLGNGLYDLLPAKKQIVLWENIKDYYIKSDHPIDIFQLLVQDKEKIHNIKVKTPQFVSQKLVQFLEDNSGISSDMLDFEIQALLRMKEE